jgi:hypothetical protein
MVAVRIGDRDYEVAAPYKLRQLETAAPHIDALNEAARTGDATSVAATSVMFRNMLGAILPGIQKIDPSVTLDSLIDEFDPTEWQALRDAFNAIFNRSGLSEEPTTGEPKRRRSRTPPQPD